MSTSSKSGVSLRDDYTHCHSTWTNIKLVYTRFYVLLIIHLDMVCKENQLDALFIFSFFISQPLHVSGMFTAHHQEVFAAYVQQLVHDTFKVTGCRPASI
jgi:hypothetical protein